MEFIKEVVLPMFFLAVGIIGGVVGGLSWVSYESCKQFEAINPDYAYSYDWPSGCKIKTDDGLFVGINQMQYINGEIKTP